MSETLDLAFHAAHTDDARDQAVAWGQAEPNIESLTVGAIRRPFPERHTWYQVTVTVEWAARDQQQLDLFGEPSCLP